MSDHREIPFGRPNITDADRAAALEVLDGHILTHGPQCKAFEAEFAAFLGEGAHAVTVSSCMASLHLSCLHFGFGPGDDVLVAAETHVATAHAVEWVGARPVFVDCDPATGNVTAARVEAAITPATKGLLLVHFAGIPCDMPAIMDVASRHGIRVIEDCALAFGARWDGRHVGLFGDAGCFSFYPVKHLTTAEGGMFVTKHADVAASVARLRAFGVDRTYAERTLPGMYDVPMLGLNYRMSELQAAIGRSQLRRAPAMLAHRRRTFEAIAAVARTIEGLAVVDANDARAASSHYCLTLATDPPAMDRRNELVRALNASGIGTSVHYPQPVPRMAYYQGKYGYDRGQYAGAERISDTTLALPVAPHVDEADSRFIGEALLRLSEARV